MTESTVIFHHPLPVEREGKSGSQVRPQQMIQAFESLGYRVDLVTGYARERTAAAQRVLADLRTDRGSYAFVYSESSTQPTLLTERNHLPTHPFLDFGFLHAAGAHGVPVGLFYRDIYWRTDYYSAAVPLRKRMVTLPMYHYDLLQYRRTVDHLFLPSLEMQSQLPWPWPAAHVSALPPGCLPVSIESAVSPTLEQGISLLFVGGIIPPTYDLRPILGALAGLPDVHLMLCCRQAEWEEVGHLYRPLPPNVTVTHASGRQLRALYAASHTVLVSHDYWYHSFAMPVKFFEAVGYGKPAIIVGDSALCRLVEREGIGWSVRSAGELLGLLCSLRAHPETYNATVRTLAEAQARHTWRSRAQQVATTLRRYTAQP